MPKGYTLTVKADNQSEMTNSLKEFKSLGLAVDGISFAIFVDNDILVVSSRIGEGKTEILRMFTLKE